MLSPGQIVERYEVELELGGGGMARVYKVRHVALGSIHALKVLDPELVVNAELRARFLEEGRIQARLKHPNILAITDVVAAPGIAGLVMDYLEGEALDQYLARAQQPPDADEVREIFLQVLEGMGFAHEHGVIHRDLKPSNIFLEQARGRRVVRVLDFGIAKVSGAEGKASTRTGVRMGTPQYMSPEQIRGARDVTTRSDIFSLGVTLYELATGHGCYLGESDFNIMEKIVRAEYVPPDVVHPGLDRRLCAAILRALDLDPERRFASCQEFAEALVAEVPVEVPIEEVPARASVTSLPVPPALPVTAVRQVTPVSVSVAAVRVAPEPAFVTAARQSQSAAAVLAPTPAPAPIVKSAPAPARARAVPSPVPEAKAGRKPRRAWLWALLFALAGVGAMFGSALLGMLMKQLK